MSEVAVVAITAAAGIGSAIVAAVAATSVARRQIKAQRVDDLTAALQGYGYAVDRLDSEIRQMPPSDVPGAKTSLKLVSLLPQLDYLIGQVQRHTIGAPAMAAMDSYMAAFNRLLLIAPRHVLDVADRLQTLVFTLDGRDAEWDREWLAARGELVRVSREVVAERDGWFRRLRRRLGSGV